MKAMVNVWDPFVRIFHWALVLSVTIAFLSEDELESLHEISGYFALVLIVARIFWGFWGPPQARFNSFVYGPRSVLKHLGNLFRGSEKRYLSHNPAGGWMVLALISTIVGLSTTGWMMTTDIYGTVDWLEDFHELLSNLLLFLVLLHISGVIFESLRHGENLIWAMFTGKKYE